MASAVLCPSERIVAVEREGVERIVIRAAEYLREAYLEATALADVRILRTRLNKYEVFQKPSPAGP